MTDPLITEIGKKTDIAAYFGVHPSSVTRLYQKRPELFIGIPGTEKFNITKTARLIADSGHFCSEEAIRKREKKKARDKLIKEKDDRYERVLEQRIKEIESDIIQKNEKEKGALFERLEGALSNLQKTHKSVNRTPQSQSNEVMVDYDHNNPPPELSPNLDQIQLEKIKLYEQARKLNIINNREEAKYVSADEIRKNNFEHGRKIRDMLLLIPARAAAIVPDDIRHDVEINIEKEIKLIIDEIISFWS